MLDLDRTNPSAQYSLRDYIVGEVENMQNDLTDIDFMSEGPRIKFNLNDEELDEYLRLTIVAILDAGGNAYIWNGKHPDSLEATRETTDRFGTGKEEIAANIVRAWRARGPRDSGMGWGDPVLFAMNPP